MSFNKQVSNSRRHVCRKAVSCSSFRREVRVNFSSSELPSSIDSTHTQSIFKLCTSCHPINNFPCPPRQVFRHLFEFQSLSMLWLLELALHCGSRFHKSARWLFVYWRWQSILYWLTAARKICNFFFINITLCSYTFYYNTSTVLDVFKKHS